MSAFKPHGRHLIAGEWVGGEATFRSSPAQGDGHDFSVGTEAHVDAARAGATTIIALTIKLDPSVGADHSRVSGAVHMKVSTPPR